MAREDADRRIRLTFQLGEFAATSLPVLPLRPPLRLTRGERQVIAMMLAGRSDAQIAKHRGTSLRTLLNQVSSVLRKLGLGSRDELLALLRSTK